MLCDMLLSGPSLALRLAVMAALSCLQQMGFSGLTSLGTNVLTVRRTKGGRLSCIIEDAWSQMGCVIQYFDKRGEQCAQHSPLRVKTYTSGTDEMRSHRRNTQSIPLALQGCPAGG